MSGGPRDSLWLETAPDPDPVPRTVAAVDVDVAVVGAGIAGITTGTLLKAAGATVAVIDAGRAASGVTAFSTAKVTAGHGRIYADLARDAGPEAAGAYALSQMSAMETVSSLVAERGIDCDLQRVDHHVYGLDARERELLEEEAAVAAELGLPAVFETGAPLPFSTDGAVGYREQLAFHPRRYLLPLVAAIPGDGSHLFQDARVYEIIEGAPCTVRAPGVTVRCRDVVVATHHPFVDRGSLSDRMTQRRSYVVTAPIAAGDAPPGTHISSGGDTHSIRTAPYGDDLLLVVSGEGHETGRADDTPQRYERLEDWMRARFPVGEVMHRWSVQDDYPLDRIPYIGRLHGGDAHVLVAAGFGGWGMTNGTLAGRLLADLLTGEPPAWAEVHSPARRPPRRSLGALVASARDAVADRVRADDRDPEELSNGEAAVVTAEGGPVAVYRDDDGALHTVSATCTHRGCIVRWNAAERSWDCPCHGSRFDPDGGVLEAPAVAPLADRSWAVAAEREA